MNAPLPVPSRTLCSRKFNECIDDLYKAFRRNAGYLTRERFRQICAVNGYDAWVIQWYFESAGMDIEYQNTRKRTPGDRFVWTVWKESL